MNKRLICILMTVALLLGIMPGGIYAEESNLRSYIYDGYTIDYEVADVWDNSQNISVTIKNTGTEAIENWMLAYDFCGEITNLWNGTFETDDNGSKYIKNAGHNAVIEPESSAVFGYTLANFTGSPDSFEMCQKRTAKESGYTVDLTVTDEWDDNFNGEIVISNTSDKPIECWELSFDSNFTIVEITDSWAASILFAENGKYILKGTYTNIIYCNSSVTIGFSGKKKGIPEIAEYSLTEVRKGNNTINSDEESDLMGTGKIYYKDIQSEEDIEFDGNGIYYVRNQILLTAKDNASFDEINALAESINAEIVGYIEITNDYQIELNTAATSEELYLLIGELQNNLLVDYASLNTVIETDEDYIPSDYDWWDGKDPAYIDWGIKAIKADQAWNYFDESVPENADRETVKLGLLDNMFDINHRDLDFEKVWDNPDSIGDDHGTHVAGIMGAIFNNEIKDAAENHVNNIAGICPKNKLYGYAFSSYSHMPIIRYKYAFALFISKNVRVINLSLSTGQNVCFGASHGNINALNYINKNSEIFQVFLKKLLDRGYDFVIVTSAGNVNGLMFKVDENENGYGYIKDDAGTYKGGANALYNSFFNNIQSVDVINHIICVGSIGFTGSLEDEQYYYADYSNIGTRVDVVAPGEDIYSTVRENNYKNSSGTSMAAPHVSGTAGMMYSVNPNLTGSQIKSIIMDTARGSIAAPNYSGTYKLIDAKAAVDKAIEYTENEEYKEKTNSVVLGIVKDEITKSPIEDVTINIYENKFGTLYKLDRNIATNENGEYEVILSPGVYKIEFTKDRYYTHDYLIEITGNNTAIMKNAELLPIETSITGTVTEYNTTTGVTRPLAAHGVAVYQDGILAASAVTSSDGTYYIELNRQGDFIVDFGGDKQTDILINSNGEYTVNAVFEVCDEEDTDGGDTGGDGEDDNEDDGDDEDDDSGNTEETDDVIIDIDIYDNTGIDPNDEGYTGNNAVSGGNFADGVTIRSKDGSYINIYYDGSYCNVWINAQSHIWFYTYGALKYDKFDANGNLISSGVIDSWLMDAMYYDTTLVYKTYITGIKITAYSDRIRVDYTYHKEQKYYGGLGDLLGESYDRSSYQNIMR
ncbi:MAG: S8 family serine peptidase [Oscillospiraceae bacterium]